MNAIVFLLKNGGDKDPDIIKQVKPSILLCYFVLNSDAISNSEY